MSNKLALVVNFLGVDKMSGALRNIVGLGRKGSTSIRSLTGESRKLERELAGVRRELSASTGNVTALMNSERALERQLEGTNRQLQRQRSLAGIAADKAAMLARAQDLRSKGQDNIVGGLGMAAPLILAGKAAADYSSGMVDIQQKTALSDAATDQLGRKILIMSKAAMQVPEDLRAGLDVLLSKGMTLDAATAAIGPAGRLATAYKVELTDAADSAFASISNLKVASSQTARIFDTMAAAGNAGGFEVRDMARYFPSLTAQMQALGEKGIPAVADLSAALQVAMHTAGGADEAGNNIQNLLGKINAPGTISAFKKNFGIDLPAAMKKLTDEGYSSLEAISLITKKATGGDMKKLGFAFEDQQARMGILALIQNLEEYRDIRQQALQSSGTVDQAFNQRATRDANAQWRALLGTGSQLAIVLGTTLLPVMTQIVGNVSNVVSSMAAWAQANPEMAGTIVKCAAALITFRLGLGAAQYAIGSILGPVATLWGWFQKLRTLGTIATMLPRIGAAFTLMTGPIGLTILAVAGLAFAIYRYWGPISGYIRSHWTQIRNIMLGAMVIFTPLVAAIVFVAAQIYRNWDGIKAATMSMIAKVAGVVGPFLRPFMVIQAFLRGLVGQFFGFGANIVGGLIRGIVSMVPSVLGAILNLAGQVGAKFAEKLGIRSPSRVFMALGGHVVSGLERGIDRNRHAPVRAISRMATGVAAAGAISLTPMQAAARPSAAGASRVAGIGSITIHVHAGPGMNVDDLAETVLRKVERLQGRAARSGYVDR